MKSRGTGTLYVSKRAQMGAAIMVGSEIIRQAYCLYEVLEQPDRVSKRSADDFRLHMLCANLNRARLGRDHERF